MRYCQRCVIPDTRPLGEIGVKGFCTACEYAEQRQTEDFSQKLEDLKAYIQPILQNNRNKTWDCIVGVSGGKDSTRQALWVREKLGLNPLLVSVAYPPRQISRIGAENLSNLNRLGFDLYVLGPAPQLSRKLVREAFFRFANWCKATEMALFAGVPRLACQLEISLLFWGENPALQVGDLGTLGSSEWDGSQLINSNTIGGGGLEWFMDVAGDAALLEMYKFPSKPELEKAGIRTVFLGPAWADWSAETNSRVSLVHGFTPRGGDPEDTGDPLGTQMVDEDWTIVNFLLKFYKLGFSRGSEYASELIRAGAISRSEGIRLAERLDGACSDRYVESFCHYIEIEVADFWAVVRRFANSKLFDTSLPGRPRKLFSIGVDT